MTHPRSERMLTVDQLRAGVADESIETVVVAFTDMQGRLQGKYLHAAYFVEHALGHGVEGCNYLLAVDTDMNTVDGYAISSWEAGYGDMEFTLDLDTIRWIPWLERTVMIQCDLALTDGTPVPMSPRAMLTSQVERAAGHGWSAVAGTELEFVVYRDSYEEAWTKGYTGLTPANQYNVDYSIVGSGRVEPLLRRIRSDMWKAGMTVESAKGECNFGQHEIGFLFDDVVTTCDNHSVYKTGAKMIAADLDQSLTFMAKPNEREGNSCHIHLSLRGLDGSTVFWEDGERTALYDHFIAGVLATMREFTLFYAPNINSYKRFAEGSFAPTAVAWGQDNRTCSVRIVGEGSAARMENRVPGGDCNPYLAVAAMMAGGLHGIEAELELEPMMTGNAYESDAPLVPHTLREARDLFAGSEVARAAFGQDVVDHYVNMADVEITAFDAAVTDWELRRGFERL
ncbi:glutamine synthetase family protein [Serinicoccus kebangsaanensis]|uniref:glutamine synthetase family protein n=1 Tax=Serinicoccus kebangsaanensis TaxID=2602069 RepID=UPI00124E0A70|nr:glutamine synthetase family protein [Serinicoccus kebangsaanensis]